MSNNPYDDEAARKCAELGLHPKHHPMGDDHHTDAPLLAEDQRAGEALAYFLGGIFIDKEVDPSTPLRDTYWHNEMTSSDVWSRVVRALRIHGLEIKDATAQPTPAVME